MSEHPKSPESNKNDALSVTIHAFETQMLDTESRVLTLRNRARTASETKDRWLAPLRTEIYAIHTDLFVLRVRFSAYIQSIELKQHTDDSLSLINQTYEQLVRRVDTVQAQERPDNPELYREEPIPAEESRTSTPTAERLLEHIRIQIRTVPALLEQYRSFRGQLKNLQKTRTDKKKQITALLEEIEAHQNVLEDLLVTQKKHWQTVHSKQLLSSRDSVHSIGQKIQRILIS